MQGLQTKYLEIMAVYPILMVFAYSWDIPYMDVAAGLKLKFYLFPLTQPTLKKSPKNFLLRFLVNIFFLILLQTYRELSKLFITIFS